MGTLLCLACVPFRTSLPRRLETYPRKHMSNPRSKHPTFGTICRIRNPDIRRAGRSGAAHSFEAGGGARAGRTRRGVVERDGMAAGGCAQDGDVSVRPRNNPPFFPQSTEDDRLGRPFGSTGKGNLCKPNRGTRRPLNKRFYAGATNALCFWLLADVPSPCLSM